MEISDTGYTAQHNDFTGDPATGVDIGNPAVTFRALLEQYEATGETRILTHQRDGVAELGVIGWAMRALELNSYIETKKQLMADEGLTNESLNKMTAAERAVFEARVFDRMRDEMAQGVKAYEEDELERKKWNLYRVVPIPDPE